LAADPTAHPVLPIPVAMPRSAAAAIEVRRAKLVA